MPWNVAVPPATRPTRFGSRPSSDSALTLLPEPDSPTRPDRLAGPDVVGQAADGPDRPTAADELDLQVLDGQERRGRTAAVVDDGRGVERVAWYRLPGSWPSGW